MPTPKWMHGLPGDECECGRRKSVRHCPYCGSTRMYPYAEDHYTEYPGVTTKSGEILYRKVRLIRCLSCPHVFSEDELQLSCGAPPIAEALAKQRIQNIHNAKASGKPLSPVEQKMANSIQAVLEVTSPKVVVHPSEADKYLAFKQVELSYRQAYADWKYDQANQGIEVTMTEREYIDKFLAEEKIERMEAPQQQEDAKQDAKQSESIETKGE